MGEKSESPGIHVGVQYSWVGDRRGVKISWHVYVNDKWVSVCMYGCLRGEEWLILLYVVFHVCVWEWETVLWGQERKVSWYGYLRWHYGHVSWYGYVGSGVKSLLVWIFGVALGTRFLIWLCRCKSEKSTSMDIWGGTRDQSPVMVICWVHEQPVSLYASLETRESGGASLLTCLALTCMCFGGMHLLLLQANHIGKCICIQ